MSPLAPRRAGAKKAIRRRRRPVPKPVGPIPGHAFEEMLALLFTVVRDRYLNPQFEFKDEDEARAAAEDLSRLRDLIVTWAPIPIAKKFLRLLKVMGKEARGDANELYHEVCLDLRGLREPEGRLDPEARAVLCELQDLRITSNFTRAGRVFRRGERAGGGPRLKAARAVCSSSASSCSPASSRRFPAGPAEPVPKDEHTRADRAYRIGPRIKDPRGEPGVASIRGYRSQNMTSSSAILACTSPLLAGRPPGKCNPVLRSMKTRPSGGITGRRAIDGGRTPG